MKANLIFIGVGGGIGSILRYLTSLFVSRHFTSYSFPFGTFAVNITGCLIIGILYGMTERFSWLSPPVRFFLITGFCGGYTTFSTFSFESMQLLNQANYSVFALYSLLSFAVCLGAVFAGFAAARCF